MSKTQSNNQTKSNEIQSTKENESQPQVYSKSDVIRARAIIQSYREAQKTKPKRKCSEKQLAALAAGREKNKRNKPKQTTSEKN